jgi:hypothetical protein
VDDSHPDMRQSLGEEQPTPQRATGITVGFQNVVWSNIGDLLRAAPHTFCTVTRSSVVPPISTVFDYGLILVYLTSLRRSLPAANYIGRLREGPPLGKEYIWEGKSSVHTVPSLERL